MANDALNEVRFRIARREHQLGKQLREPELRARSGATYTRGSADQRTVYLSLPVHVLRQTAEEA